MGIIRDGLNDMGPKEQKTLTYEGFNFISDYPAFIPLVEEVIYLAIQGQLEITESSHKESDNGILYITSLKYKRIT